MMNLPHLQGIDSHLEAVYTEQRGDQVVILDDSSLRCFVRRCVESDCERAHDLISAIMDTLGIEWV